MGGGKGGAWVKFHAADGNRKFYLYIFEVEYLSVRYAFSPCNSYDHQTFHDASLGPREGRRGVGMVIEGWNVWRG